MSNEVNNTKVNDQKQIIKHEHKLDSRDGNQHKQAESRPDSKAKAGQVKKNRSRQRKNRKSASDHSKQAGPKQETSNKKQTSNRSKSSKTKQVKPKQARDKQETQQKGSNRSEDKGQNRPAKKNRVLRQVKPENLSLPELEAANLQLEEDILQAINEINTYPEKADFGL